LALQTPTLDEDLLSAARGGDLEKVKDLLGKGAKIEAKTRYGQTPLYLAATKGRVDVLKFLIAKGAKVDVKDTFYKASMLEFVMMGNHVDTMKVLLDSGKFPPETLTEALASAESDKKTEMVEILKQAGAKPLKADFAVPAETLASYAGVYRNDQLELVFEVKDGKFMANGQGATFELAAKDATHFVIPQAPNVALEFKVENGKAVSVTINQDGNVMVLPRVEAK